MSATIGANAKSSSGSDYRFTASLPLNSLADTSRGRNIKKFVLACAVFAHQARNEGRWGEFFAHVCNRFWSKWPEHNRQTAESLTERISLCKEGLKKELRWAEFALSSAMLKPPLYWESIMALGTVEFDKFTSFVARQAEKIQANRASSRPSLKEKTPDNEPEKSGDSDVEVQMFEMDELESNKEIANEASGSGVQVQGGGNKNDPIDLTQEDDMRVDIETDEDSERNLGLDLELD